MVAHVSLLMFTELTNKSMIGTVTILICRRLGWIKDLAPFDYKKARTCTFSA
jgi:hypothetical protein